MFGGADADLLTKLVLITIQEGCEDLAERPIGLGTILGYPRPHRGERVGEAFGFAATARELDRQTVTTF